MSKFITVYFCILSINLSSSFNPLIRRTRYGFVQGTFERSMANSSVEYLSFMGIPYARPPVRQLRFQEPLPPEKWTGIRKANQHAEICVQFSEHFNGPDVVGSEDCLYLNVFVPKTRHRAQLMPVMFWIHGGNFIFASSKNAGPDYVVEEGVIWVSIQYRLNVFGFLSTEDHYASGNYGLKDQVMAMKWVKDNIKNFGGDPKRVTILGESAGGASVQYHLLSTKSRGLFQRAISHSGSTLDRWAHQEHPRQMLIKLAKGLKIPETSTKELVELLRKVNYKTLITAAFNASIVGFYTPYFAQPFTASIESQGKSAFISNSTYELLKQGHFNKVPYILGYNTEEGSFGYDYVKNGREDIDRYLNPKYLVPIALNLRRDTPCFEDVLKNIISFYFKNGLTNDKTNWINFMSQELFVRGIRKSVELMVQHMPLYYYRFSYRGSRNESYVGGVGHHEELMYLWFSRKPGANNKETGADILTRKRFVKMWTNFAATGNPTPDNDSLLQNITWPKVIQNEKVPFLDIGDNLKVELNPDQEDYEFWEKIFKLCGNSPYTSY